MNHIKSCKHYAMMTHNMNDLYHRIHRQLRGYCHMVTNVLRKPILSGPLESDIEKVRDISEITTEHKVCY